MLEFYYGFTISNEVNLFKFLEKVRETALSTHTRLYEEFLAQHNVQDDADVIISFLLQAQGDYYKVGGKTDPYFCELRLFYSETERKMYGLLRSRTEVEQQYWEDLQTVDGFVDYGFWGDHAPLPEDITLDEWNERQRVWEGIFSNPALVRLKYDMFEQDYHSPSLILKRIREGKDTV